ncbi:MAG: septum formation initiator family protein [Desulfobacteraceae bacterium]
MNFPKRPTIYAILVAMSILLGLIVFSDNGLMELRRLQKEHKRITQQNIRLMNRNHRLHRIIQRLKSDPNYVEHIARKELGMVGTHQIIFKLSNKKREKSSSKKK